VSEPEAQAEAPADEVEASRAPLIEHLIELRTRLIRSLIAIFIAFIGCFFFARHIYNVLVLPYEWAAGNETVRLIYTAPQEFFLTQMKLALFGAVFIAFPVIAASSRPASTRTSGRRSSPIWWRRRCSSSAARRWCSSW
jgi:sec-independent protein translocase protein TatC